MWLFEFDTVEKVDLQAGQGVPRVDSPSQASRPPNSMPRDISRLASGIRFASLEDLVADQLSAGYLKVGTFGNHWPATVTEVATDRDGIRFVRQDGTKHNYTNFGGYTLKMVRLQAGRDETIVVFRSENRP